MHEAAPRRGLAHGDEFSCRERGRAVSLYLGAMLSCSLTLLAGVPNLQI